MDNSYQATESQTADGSESNGVQCGTMPNDDQFFLMYFIMGIYFGPGVKDCPQKSALQRAAENLAAYTSDQLIGTQMRTVEVERIYYHVLRKADQSVLVKLPLLHSFFQGNLHTPGEQRSASMHPQFPDLFPSHLHPHSRSLSGYKVIENIVFINSPETSYMKPDDIERFKNLTGLESFILNRDAARTHTSATGGGVYSLNIQENESNGDYRATKPCGNTSRIGDPFHDVHVVTPISSISHNGTPMRFSYVGQPHSEPGARSLKEFGPAMIYLPSHPNMKEWENIVAATRSGFALTGSAAQGQVGPVIGLMDIGECDDSYLFRVSLPGVKRDGREFSCEVEPDGRVLIKGVTTTGEKRVYRHSQMFEMQTQNLCPPGNFSISFQLPGPVNPLQFTGHFGTDGVLEGVVMKEKQKK